MKLTALDIMKCNVFLLIGLFFGIISTFSQSKQEREFRIEEAIFPKNAKNLLDPYLINSKRIRYYKEFDGEKISFEAKFKKDRLKYSIEFSESGLLEDVEFIIKEVDIPDSTFDAITSYLISEHRKYRIKKIQQQYLNDAEKPKEVLKVAFQNLILPEVNYEIVIASKDEKGYAEYEITFNSDGKHLLSRRSKKPEYDHILY